MSEESQKPAIGSIGWVDLTVPDAPKLRDFYASVVGLGTEDVDMGEYADFTMMDSSGTAVAGVCHKRGTNAAQPSTWMIYFIVADCAASAQRTVELGGEVVVGPKTMGSAQYCVVKDPAGAHCALYQP